MRELLLSLKSMKFVLEGTNILNFNQNSIR